MGKLHLPETKYNNWLYTEAKTHSLYLVNMEFINTNMDGFAFMTYNNFATMISVQLDNYFFTTIFWCVCRGNENHINSLLKNDKLIVDKCIQTWVRLLLIKCNVLWS